MNKNKENNFFSTRLFQFRVEGHILFWQLRVPGGDLPWTGFSSVTGLTHTHMYSLILGQLRHVNEPHMYSFGMWEEIEVPGENTHRHRQKCTLHTQGDHDWESLFFLSTL